MFFFAKHDKNIKISYRRSFKAKLKNISCHEKRVEFENKITKQNLLHTNSGSLKKKNKTERMKAATYKFKRAKNVKWKDEKR